MFHETEYTDHQAELTFRLTDSPTAQERVLSFLLNEAGEPATEAEVRDAVDLPKTTTHVALTALAEQGVVKAQRVGRTGLYSVDISDPLVRTLKIARAVRRVQLVVSPLRAEIDLVVLFGSASCGEDRAGSDVDLFVVARDAERVGSHLARHQWLQAVVRTPEAHMRLIADGGTFATEITRGTAIWERR
ncbi:MAG: nucleotidyltransferase domain-containing protein [Actinobacteria bacterium]|nr:nucleotidyltransferase domain-containing protein [Actinomycetota bacterium]